MLHQSLNSSHRFFFVCWLFYQSHIGWQRFSQMTLQLISLILVRTHEFTVDFNKKRNTVFLPLPGNRKWTAHSHNLQEDRTAIQHAETKTWMHDRHLRRKKSNNAIKLLLLWSTAWKQRNAARQMSMVPHLTIAYPCQVCGNKSEPGWHLYGTMHGDNLETKIPYHVHRPSPGFIKMLDIKIIQTRTEELS